MEPLNNTYVQRVRNLRGALYEWTTSLSDSGAKSLNPEFHPIGTWEDKGAEPVTETEDVAYLFTVAAYRLTQPGINLDSWFIYGEDLDAPDMLVIDVEGVVLGVHIEEDQENSQTPYTLHVRVLDHLPDVKVSCCLGAGDVSISVSGHMCMWWTLDNPTRGQVKEALRNLLIAAHRFRGELRVNRMRRIDAALATQGMESVKAHNYRDLVDWLTPQVGIDMGGEQWGRETWVRLMDADGTPENQSATRTTVLMHPDVDGNLHVAITEYDGPAEWAVSMEVTDSKGRSYKVNGPTHADIAGAIAKWVMLNRKEGQD